jgi:hypothetical protein
MRQYLVRGRLQGRPLVHLLRHLPAMTPVPTSPKLQRLENHPRNTTASPVSPSVDHRLADVPPVGGDGTLGTSCANGTRFSMGDGSVAPLAPANVPTCPQTRLQQGIRKPEVHTNGMIRYAQLTTTGEPSSVQEVLDHTQWKQAMDNEYHALQRNRTWHLVSPKSGSNIIDCKWVFKIKR